MTAQLIRETAEQPADKTCDFHPCDAVYSSQTHIHGCCDKVLNIFQQLSHVPEIDPSPLVFFVWPLPAHSRAGLLCSSTTPTFASLRRWTNVLFPKSEIHLQLVSLPPTQIKGVPVQQEQKLLSFCFFNGFF